MTCAATRAIGRRWVMFHTVGAGGFLVQMACLWGLAEGAGIHYLASAAIALEAAILHNFTWHARWTWGDRPAAAGRTGLLTRLARFNLLHGATALSNLAITATLVEVGGLHYMAAAVVSIAACALVNFVVSDRAIFTASIAAAACLTGGAGSASAEPSSAAQQAFDRRAQTVERRLDEGTPGDQPLWIDRLPPRARDEARRKLLDGEVIVHAAEVGGATGSDACADALCHHWAATVLVPGVDADAVIALMQAYDDYAEIYDPSVRRSRLLSRQGDRYAAFLRLQTKKVVTVVLDTEYDVQYMRVSGTRVRVDSRSTRVAEIASPGESDEREKPPDGDHGFLWRLNTYCLVDSRAEGAYVQCESLSLTRSIPTGLGWIVRPFVTSVPKESLTFTLGRMRTHLAAVPCGARDAHRARCG